MIKLKLTKSIYQLQHIEYGIEQFKPISTITVSNNAEYFDCSFSNCKYDETTTKNEFENYLIDLINSHEYRTTDN